MDREISAESNRIAVRWLEQENALKLLGEGKLRVPTPERLAKTDADHPHGHRQATTKGDDAVVEYMDDEGDWQLARVYWDTYEVILAAT